MSSKALTPQERLAALKARREQILTQQNVRSTEIDGQRTEFFAPNLRQLEAEIAKLESEIGQAATMRRRPIGVYF